MKAKSLKHILKRPLAFLLICALLLPTMILAQAALTTPPDVAAPDVKVVSTLIGGQYLEVGLNIDNKEAGTTFQSAGVLLTYDPKVLIPVKWDKEATIINLVPIDPANAATAGEKATILPTKGSDVLSGKLAEAVEVGDKGYLYISAEAARTMSLRQTLPAKPGPIVAPSGQKPFPTETAKGKIPISYLWEAGTATEQATVLRFVLKAKPEQALYDYAEIVEALDVVVVDESTRDIVESMPLANPSSPLTYIADNTDFTTAGYDKAVNLQFVWILDGQTVNSGGGGGSTEGIIAITAFDWDGTMLGSFIFAADNDPVKQQENAQAAMDAFVAQPEIDAVLKSHAGYDFLAWVKNDNNVPSSYGKRVLSNSDTTLEDLTLEEENKVDFSTFTQSGTVKAGYVTNASCQTGDGMSVADAIVARQYKTSVDSYGRFGTGNSFSVKIKVERGNVPRSTMGALRVRMNIDGVDVFSQYALSGADSEIIEVAPFAQSNSTTGLKGVSLVEWTVIDTHGASNWVNAAARTRVTECQSKAEFTVKSVGTANNIAVWDDGTYPLHGIVASFNDGLREYYELLQQNPGALPSTITVISAAIVRSIGIPPSTANNNNLRKAIYDGWVAQGMQNMDYATLYKIASGT